MAMGSVNTGSQIMPQFFKDYNINEKGAMDLEKSFIAVKEHQLR